MDILRRVFQILPEPVHVCVHKSTEWWSPDTNEYGTGSVRIWTRDLELASMARDDPPASSTASSTAPACSTAAAMRGKVGSEFET